MGAARKVKLIAASVFIATLFAALDIYKVVMGQ